jgi:hypothetical protein
MVGHPHPQPPQSRAPPALWEPLARPLWPLAPREPPAGPLQPPALQEPPAAPLPPSIVGPHHSKPQERPSVGVGRPKCPAKKTTIKSIK